MARKGTRERVTIKAQIDPSDEEVRRELGRAFKRLAGTLRDDFALRTHESVSRGEMLGTTTGTVLLVNPQDLDEVRRLVADHG